MANANRNLYLFEAIELRKEYDRQIRLFENLLAAGQPEKDRLFSRREDGHPEPAIDFDPKTADAQLRRLQARRIKLNQAIQAANFSYQLKFDEEQISLAEALEIRKHLMSELKLLEQKVLDSAYKSIIHKEERDIVLEPRTPFRENYEAYHASLGQLRDLMNKIHVLNHSSLIEFREE